MEETSETANQWLDEAREAFQKGDYRNAARLAAHAAIDDPQDPKVHELASLALFAGGQYRGAAMEAYAALAIAPPADWATLYAYYNDLPNVRTAIEGTGNVPGEESQGAGRTFPSRLS